MTCVKPIVTASPGSTDVAYAGGEPLAAQERTVGAVQVLDPDLPGRLHTDAQVHPRRQLVDQPDVGLLVAPDGDRSLRGQGVRREPVGRHHGEVQRRVAAARLARRLAGRLAGFGLPNGGGRHRVRFYRRRPRARRSRAKIAARDRAPGSGGSRPPSAGRPRGRLRRAAGAPRAAGAARSRAGSRPETNGVVPLSIS